MKNHLLRHLTVASVLCLGTFSLPSWAAPNMSLTAPLTGASEVPAVMTSATGRVEATLTPDTHVLSWRIVHAGLSGPVTKAHFHGPAMANQNSGVSLDVTGSTGSPITGRATLTAAQAADLVAGKWYMNLHTAAHPDGEVRGQVSVRP